MLRIDVCNKYELYIALGRKTIQVIITVQVFIIADRFLTKQLPTDFRNSKLEYKRDNIILKYAWNSNYKIIRTLAA